MYISKISAVSNYNCSFNARQRNNIVEEVLARPEANLCDYFDMGYKRLDALYDYEDCDIYDESSFNQYRPPIKQEEDRSVSPIAYMRIPRGKSSTSNS